MSVRTSFLALLAVAASAAGIVELRGIGGSVSSLDARDTTEVSKDVRVGKQDAIPAQLTAQNEAQPATPAVQAQAGSDGTTTAPQQPIDLSALRYFAARGDTARLQAEIARLQALYPGWEPPADPLAIANTGDPRLEALWQLYAEGRYDEVEKAIAERKASEPGFVPPQELVDGIRLAKSRQALVDASDNGDDQSVVEIAAAAPQLLTCGEVDVLWRLAEAFARTDRADRAVDAYGYILKNCDNAQEREATVQKASLFLDVPQVEELMRFERKDGNGQPEFEAIRDDIARAFVSRAADDVSVTVPDAYVERLEAAARRDKLASDAILLGWYRYQHEMYPQARDWFQAAFDQDATPEAAQGLALAEIALNNPGNAEAVLYDFRDHDEETGKVYLSAVANLLGLDPPKAIASSVLARMAPVVIDERDPVAAEQFGWYAHYLQQDKTAVEWFKLALTWDPEHEPAAYGLALALTALGDKAGVSRVQDAWAARSERIRLLHETARTTAPKTVVQTEPAPPRTSGSATPAASSGQTGQATSCRSTINFATLAPDQALASGWCLMQINRPIEAVRAFERALASSSEKTRADAAYGQSLAYLRLKMPNKAAAAAASAPLSAERATELQSAILSDRAVESFKHGRYRETIIALDQRSRFAAERQDLMILRGFAYHKLGRRADAKRIFDALANIGNTEALKALNDLEF